GDGSGSGSGDGSKDYWQATILHFSRKWPETQQSRLGQLKAEGATIAFWRSNQAGKACNGGRSSEGVSAGTVESIDGPLRICSRNALHATFIPPKWKGERVWVVALIGEVQFDEDKAGALKREIIGECI
ncbi:MAG: hypothetical protein KGL35_05335, partial [Bradyrhizobium sp.]|nr:hypothetical protein [Bradyrhizobium sp.]